MNPTCSRSSEGTLARRWEPPRPPSAAPPPPLPGRTRGRGSVQRIPIITLLIGFQISPCSTTGHQQCHHSKLALSQWELVAGRLWWAEGGGEPGLCWARPRPAPGRYLVTVTAITRQPGHPDTALAAFTPLPASLSSLPAVTVLTSIRFSYW